MRPQFSIIFFTTLAGMAQGLLFFLAIADLQGDIFPVTFLAVLALPTALSLLAIGLIASIFHLGRPERAWRAIMMWKTSWLSREVITLPIVMAANMIALLFAFQGQVPQWLWLVLIVSLIALWVCTAKIYQCIRFIQEWSHPSTLANFILLGLTSGWLLLDFLANIWSQPSNSINERISSVGFLLLFFALCLKLWIWRRNKNLKPKSNLASATGIKGNGIRQISMGLMGGSFNTREFFHHQTDFFIGNIKKVILVCAYIVPMLLMLVTFLSPGPVAIGFALLIHSTGLLAERWMFFAEANHPQNLYYQRVS